MGRVETAYVGEKFGAESRERLENEGVSEMKRSERKSVRGCRKCGYAHVRGGEERDLDARRGVRL